MQVLTLALLFSGLLQEVSKMLRVFFVNFCLFSPYGLGCQELFASIRKKIVHVHTTEFFSVLFRLTLLETGTRVARFVFQESVAEYSHRAKIGGKPSWGLNILMSFLTCCCWGYLL